MAHVDVYLDDFISICQGGSTEIFQILRHILRSTDTVFRLNIETYGLCKEPIYTKNIGQGDSDWSTNKTVLEWEFDKKEQNLRLIP